VGEDLVDDHSLKLGVRKATGAAVNRRC